jgi:hypothetical protein
MAISIGASSFTALAAEANSVVVTAPTGIVDGDILVGAYYHSAANTNGVTLPSGFTQWGVNASALDGYRFLHFCWKRAQSESGDYTFARESSLAASITVVKGCVMSGDPANVAISNTMYQTSNTIVRAASITPTSECCLLWVGIVYADPYSLYCPTGFTEQLEARNIGRFYSLNVGTKLNQAAESTGNIDGSILATTTVKHAMMVALKPAVGSLIPILKSGNRIW